MNFLAHAYLSFNNPDLLVGNLIADMVKGKQIENFPEGIRRGIQLHRHIDSFTDSHPVSLKAKNFFKKSAGRYSMSFIDVSYDHFLALDDKNEPEEGWKQFAENCYHQLELRGDILPTSFCSMFLYMKNEDWLYNYRHKWLIDKSFERMKNRANYLSEDAPIFEDFEAYYEGIKESYNLFFPDLKQYVEDVLPEYIV